MQPSKTDCFYCIRCALRLRFQQHRRFTASPVKSFSATHELLRRQNKRAKFISRSRLKAGKLTSGSGGRLNSPPLGPLLSKNDANVEQHRLLRWAKGRLEQLPNLVSLQTSFRMPSHTFFAIVSKFQSRMKSSLEAAYEQGTLGRKINGAAFSSDHFSPSRIDSFLRDELFTELLKHERTTQVMTLSRGAIDLRYPVEWFPMARKIERTVHLHVGPTNSGKTYQALKRLEQAETGVYAGPLRLLAHEVYTRLNAKGKACDLVTGDEVRESDENEKAMVSCTVEMTPLGREVDVAVLDEIQMISSEERGWAWTQAFLGVRAHEVHLCGEARTISLIRQLTASTGDKLQIHHYERLSPLKVQTRSLGKNIKNLRKGDCLVVFSKILLHALKKDIERETGKKCAVIYGSLPPETRAAQAKLFNDPDSDYDILVATDAIGMGLNLNIKRIIFWACGRKSKVGWLPLTISQIKQIAGRAGRYRTTDDATTKLDAQEERKGSLKLSPPSVGLVTTFEDADLPAVQHGMTAEPKQITSAGLRLPTFLVEKFASNYPPRTPFSYIIRRMEDLAKMHSRYHLCVHDDQLQIADLIEDIKGLSISDRFLICVSPGNAETNDLGPITRALAQCIAEQKGDLLDIPEFNLELLDETPKQTKEYLTKLEVLHRAMVLYLWLGYRFPGMFTSKRLAFHIKHLVEERIDHILASLPSLRGAHGIRRFSLKVVGRPEPLETVKKHPSRALPPPNLGFTQGETTMYGL